MRRTVDYRIDVIVEQSYSTYKDRRKRLEQAIALLDKAEADFNEAKELIDDCASEEREGFDNLTEGLQAADRGQQMDAAATSLEDASSALDQIDFADIKQSVEDAING